MGKLATPLVGNWGRLVEVQPEARSSSSEKTYCLDLSLPMFWTTCASPQEDFGQPVQVLKKTAPVKVDLFLDVVDHQRLVRKVG